jgi:ankyrin repeat protein
MQVRRVVCVLPCLAVSALLSPPAGAADKVDKKVVAFFVAVREGDLGGIQEAVRKKVNLDILDENENTALCIAATAGRADVVDALLKAGARVDQPNGIGVTPLMLAARNGHGDLAQVLLAAGANQGAIDERGRSLLLDGGAALNARDLKSGHTALMAAALSGHDEVVTALLVAGADITLKDNDGETAQRLAELSQHPSTAELLKPRPAPAPRKPATRNPHAKPAPRPTPKPTPKP